MSLKSNLIKLLSDKDYTPLTFEEICANLELTEKSIDDLKTVLDEGIKEGTIINLKHGRFGLAREADLISGIIKFKPSGSALFFPDTAPGTPLPEPINIRAHDTDVAFHKDHVLARIFKKRPKPQYRYRKGKRLNRDVEPEVYAKVKYVLERNADTICGTLQKGKNLYFVVPDDPRFAHDIYVPSPKESKLKPKPQINDKVIVKLIEWKHPHLLPEGVITHIIGPTHEPYVEYVALLHKYSLNPSFPKEVMREVASIPSKVSEKEVDGRKDCRDLFTLTIDPDDAQDFDDAISIEERSDGNTRIGIHIADVSAYVKRDTSLDKEAKKRGNSTYLVGMVIPMLPKELSNGICSLVEDEDRLTKSVFITFDRNGNVQDTEFSNTVIRSNKRLTYHQAYSLLKEGDLNKIRDIPLPKAHETGFTGRPLKDLSDNELLKIQETIKALWKFASKVRKERMQAGSLDFDMPECKIHVDEQGYPERIEHVEYDESHQLIEEYMLLANEFVAKSLFDNNVALISRVHDKPDTDKLNELRDTLETFGIKTGDLTNRKSVIKLLKTIKDHPQGYTLKIQFLRSLKQACYRAQADGHYGLNKNHYAHFTSPIRRYTDLILHRIFDNYLIKKGNETAPKEMHKGYKQNDLEGLAQHLSITEQNSTEAERESNKIKLLEYFELELKKPQKTRFKAIVTEVRNYGLFIELTESMAFGLIPLSTIEDDIYKLNADGTALIGKRTKRKFYPGGEVEVYVKRVDRFKREIDFVLVE